VHRGEVFGDRKVTPTAIRDFKSKLAERIINDPTFAKALLDEATTLFRNGEPGVALFIRDIVAAATRQGRPSGGANV
jgi:hypothetical protein